MCAYGDYLRALSSSFGGSCPNLTKFVDDFLSHWNSPGSSWTRVPASIASKYFVKVAYDGTTYNAITGYSTSKVVDYGLNIADPNYQSYLFESYVPNVFLPNGPNAKNHLPSDPSHPTYLSMDGFKTDYSFLGVDANGSFTSNVIWEPGYAQNWNQWLAGWEAYFAFAKQYAPTIRLSPHIGSMSFPNWSAFQQLYIDCPAMMRETFSISSLSTMGSYSHSQFYNQLVNLYWFANIAPPVFSTAVNPNEPLTRVLQWGTWLDNGDIHTALATYSMVRGPNTFFDVVTPGGAQYAVNPSQWLPIATAIGAGTSAPTVIRGTATNGTVLLQRTWQHGISFLNLSGTTQVISLPAGSKNWVGNAISSLTLPNGKGDVVLTK